MVLSNGDSLGPHSEIVHEQYREVNETHKPLWGKSEKILDRYNEVKVEMKHRGRHGLRFNIYFRVYNDGLAFRYEIPVQQELTATGISDELSCFNLPGDPQAWWQPANYSSYEMPYNQSKLSEAVGIIKENENTNLENLPNQNTTAFNTPLTVKTQKGYWVCIHEAGQNTFTDMTLSLQSGGKNQNLKSSPVPLNDSLKAIFSPPFFSPWRAIVVASKANMLPESNLIYNLNDSCAVAEAENWCRPLKYVGIWWGYRTGRWSWRPGHPHLPHGATTQRAKEYIQFAAQNGFGGVLIEGWNGFRKDNVAATSEQPFEWRSFTQAYPDFNLKEVAHYAKAHGVELILHNETMGSISNYENQLEEAFRLYSSLGIHYVKTGSSAPLQNNGFTHHSQPAQAHYKKVLDMALKYKINLLTYASGKNTGLEKTFPHLLSGGGVKGNATAPASYATILPFTAAVGGPIDYKPGIFNLHTQSGSLHSTRARQLALYIVFYSPALMAPDFIENYKNDKAFQFIKDLPLTWDETDAILAEPGDYVVMARKKGTAWFLGGITDENERTLKIPLDFLSKGRKYKATIYSDGEKKHSPTVVIEQKTVTKHSELFVKLKAEGGVAIKFIPLQFVRKR